MMAFLEVNMVSCWIDNRVRVILNKATNLNISNLKGRHASFIAKEVFLDNLEWVQKFFKTLNSLLANQKSLKQKHPTLESLSIRVGKQNGQLRPVYAAIRWGNRIADGRTGGHLHKVQP